jgi:hypothetical protein
MSRSKILVVMSPTLRRVYIDGVQLRGVSRVEARGVAGDAMRCTIEFVGVDVVYAQSDSSPQNDVEGLTETPPIGTWRE